MGSTFQPYQHNSIMPRAWLYQVVFRQGLLGATLAALLLLLMLLQPLQPLYAAEPDAATEEATETTETDEGGDSEPVEETTAESEETASVAEPDAEEDLTAADEQSPAEESTVEEEGSNSDESESLESEEEIVVEESESNPDSAQSVDDTEQGELSEPATTSVRVSTSSSSSAADESDEVATTTVADAASTSTATASSSSSATTSDASDEVAEGGSDESDTDPAENESGTTDNDSDSDNADSDSGNATSASEESGSTADTEESVAVDSNMSTAASSSDEVVVETAPTSHVSDANRHQFSAEECVVVGDGSYYCSATEEVEIDTENDIVYARRSVDGYSEIYLQTAQGEQRITDNQYDDSAPHYDQQSGSIVWHREIDGRYQIMSYDLRSQETEQITNTSAHNMQPTRAGDYTVWQRWDNGHWQVVLRTDGTETQLTDQEVHNVAPYVYGTYIIWNTTGTLGEPKIAVYDVATELISYISNDEGGRVRNPRFVLVYDTELANGDVLTQGFDPETGETEPLSSVPAAPLPDIPSPDPVGETRALLPQKTASSSEDKVTKQSSDDEEATDPEVATSTVSVKDTASSTVDMTASTTAAAELSEYDLVVTPYSTTTASTSQVSAQETISEE